jgi:sterol desaturase/sphingolipid hydroxylase (fatty acid hydroxylase superfamily)
MQFFLGTFILMALWEIVAPLRVAATSKAIRWPNHLVLAAMNIVLVRILFQLAAVALANVRIPRSLDRVLRWFVVTPDMHRIHHSIHADETDSNFGFVLPWWDRVFGTYRTEPAESQARMVVGIESFRRDRDLWLDRLVLNPILDQRDTQPMRS